MFSRVAASSVAFAKRYQKPYFAYYPFFCFIIPAAMIYDGTELSVKAKTNYEALAYLMGSAGTGVALSLLYPVIIPASMAFYIYKRVQQS